MKKQFEDEVNKQDPVTENLSEETENYYEHIRRVREEQSAPKKRNRKKEILIIAGALVAAAILLLATRGFTEELKWQKVGGAAHQYYGGASTVINPDTELKLNADGQVISKNDNEQIAELPIYFDDRDAVVLTETFEYYDPRSNVKRQVEPLTEIYLKNGSVYAVKGDKELRVEKGFLYNGKDKFVFLEPVTIAINDTSFEIPALSYVEADAYGTVTVFNYKTKKTEIIKAENGADAYPEGKAYTVQMLSDSIIYSDGMRMLLFFAPEKLDKLL